MAAVYLSIQLEYTNCKIALKIVLLEGRQSIFLQIGTVYILRGSDYILCEKNQVN